MRFIVYGAGAIGGLLAASLARSGQQVIAIARGAQLQAIQQDGLQVKGVEQSFHARFDCVESPAAISFAPDDVILLCMKTQGTQQALYDLRDAGVTDQPVFCVQNGVANEPMAARIFPNVHGVTVLMPNTFITPGVIGVLGHPRFGVFELGRYPHGNDAADRLMAEALGQANVACFVMDDVMAGKYGKLTMNSTNILGAALGKEGRKGTLADRIKEEVAAVYAAAGIVPRDVGPSDPRRQSLLKTGEVPGLAYIGSSTAQSLARGAGGIETDFLNGEIVLLGQQHGVPTPFNLAMTRVAALMLREGRAPGSMTLAEVEAMIPA